MSILCQIKNPALANSFSLSTILIFSLIAVSVFAVTTTSTVPAGATTTYSATTSTVPAQTTTTRSALCTRPGVILVLNKLVEMEVEGLNHSFELIGVDFGTQAQIKVDYGKDVYLKGQTYFRGSPEIEIFVNNVFSTSNSVVLEFKEKCMPVGVTTVTTAQPTTTTSPATTVTTSACPCVCPGTTTVTTSSGTTSTVGTGLTTTSTPGTGLTTTTTLSAGTTTTKGATTTSTAPAKGAPLPNPLVQLFDFIRGLFAGK